jgi:hypothetical protein
MANRTKSIAYIAFARVIRFLMFAIMIILGRMVIALQTTAAIAVINTAAIIVCIGLHVLASEV